MATTSSIDLQNFYPDGLTILDVLEKEDSITICMQSKSIQFICPNCNTVSHMHHGTYHRRVQDLQLFQKTVLVQNFHKVRDPLACTRILS